MKGRFWLSAVLALVGAGLLVASTASGGTSGSAASDKSVARGGTFRILNTSDVDHIDPALSYFTHSWNLQGATQLRLYYYPYVKGPAGQRIAPMAATGMPRVSNGGKTYTITIKPGFKFSNGQNVTAANFKRAFDRGTNQKLQSPAISFLDDVASVRTQGNNTLILTLKRVAPDFVSRITMPFFSAVPASYPLDTEVDKGPAHSAGPYYYSEWNKKTSVLAVRNPHWNNAKEPFKSLGFQNNVDRIVLSGSGGDLATHRLQCERNEADWCGFPNAQAKELADKYGVNKGRFTVDQDLLVWRVDLNNEQPLFKNNPKLRQAVLHALDRRFMTAQHGYLAGKRTDQFLPYGMDGFKEADIYSVKGPNYAKARQMAQGNTRSGKAIFYAFNRNQGPPVAQSVQFNLKQIGLDVEIKLYDRVVQNTKAATRGEPFDITHEGWHADYPDPANFINVLLDGRRLQAENNVNTSYFAGDGVANFAKKLDAAYAASGAQRLNLYAALDRDIMANGAPSAPYISASTRRFWGPDVAMSSFISNIQVGPVLVNIAKG
jgi:peptide/nickel transport system substrate-binding protein